MKSNTMLLGMTLLGLASMGFAATQGTMGKTSQANFSLNVGFSPAVLISKISGDINVSQSDWRSSFKTQEIDFCVYSNTASHKYKVTASGFNPVTHTLGDGYSYEADSPAPISEGEYFQYQVKYKADNSSLVDLQNGIPSTDAFTGSDTPDCNGVSGGTNAGLYLEVATRDGNASRAGTYTDTLNLEITPVV